MKVNDSGLQIYVGKSYLVDQLEVKVLGFDKLVNQDMAVTSFGNFNIDLLKKL